MWRVVLLAAAVMTGSLSADAQMLQLIVNARTVIGQTSGCSPFGVSVSGTPINVSSTPVNLCH